MKAILRMLTVVAVVVAGASVSRTVQAQGPSYFVMPAPFAPPAITAFNGGASIALVYVIPLNGFTGTISFTCAVTGALTPPPTCIPPPPLKVAAGATGLNTTIVIATSTKMTPTGTYFVSLTAKSDRGVPPMFTPVAFPIDIRHELVVGSGR
jgi:hypothetical protein